MPRNNETHLVANKGRREIWAKYDDSGAVWELFASADANDYLGACADTLKEAETIGRRILREEG